MLLNKDSCRERVASIVAMDRDGALQDNGAAIQLRRHDVDCDATHLDAVFNGLALRIDAWKSRQKRGVYVENGVWERLQQRRADQPHVAGQTDEANVPRAQFSDDCAVVIVAG